MRGGRRVELGAGAEAGVGEPLAAEPLDGLGVGVLALALEVGPPVPGEPEPGEVVHEEPGGLAALRARVEVLDAQHEPAAL